MAEALTPPDQESGEPLLVVKYNVPFAIPIPNLEDAILDSFIIVLLEELPSFKSAK